MHKTVCVYIYMYIYHLFFVFSFLVTSKLLLLFTLLRYIKAVLAVDATAAQNGCNCLCLVAAVAVASAAVVAAVVATCLFLLFNFSKLLLMLPFAAFVVAAVAVAAAVVDAVVLVAAAAVVNVVATNRQQQRTTMATPAYNSALLLHTCLQRPATCFLIPVATCWQQQQHTHIADIRQPQLQQINQYSPNGVARMESVKLLLLNDC